ncbi:hypothetical protein Tco_0768730 [Tanacetum coccineum]
MLCEWRIRKKGSKADPYVDYDNGLKKLSSDQDVLQMLKYVEKYKVIDLYVDHSVTKETLNVDESLLVNELDNDLFIGNQMLGDNDEDVIEDLIQSSRNESMNVEYDMDHGSHRDHGSGSRNGFDKDDGADRDDGVESYCHQAHWLSTWKTSELVRVFTCGKCKGIGHNQKKCPNDDSEQTTTQTQQSSQASPATQATQTGHTTPFHPSQLHALPSKMTKATAARRMSSS